MKALRNKETGEMIEANGVDFLNNQIRLASGENKAYPSLWTDCNLEVESCDDKAIEYLATTEEYANFEIITL